MGAKETISMTQNELTRVHIIQLVISRKLKHRKAAELLNLSIRQIQRIAKKLKRLGPKGIIHTLRGKPSNHKYSQKFKIKVIHLYETKYGDFGPTLATEKLYERDKIKLGTETLRLWLIEAELWSRQRKVDQHRKWREPKACLGEMNQFDGSHHDWLEGRGPWLVLIGHIDDATGTVFATFHDYEGTLPAMDSYFQYIIKYGLPQSVYLDRHTTYRSNAKLTLEDELAAKTRPDTQVGRALKELGTTIIHAQSPQAKGRIERLFKTFQDRLVKEMRLEGIKTKDEANKFLKTYLPKYNKRFEREPALKTNLHRPIPKGIHLKHVLAIQTKRFVRNDNTIQHDRKLYQIDSRWKSRRPKQVTVIEQFDGTFQITDQSKTLHFHEIKARPKRIHEGVKKQGKVAKKSAPTLNHPWRKLFLPKKAKAAA